LFLQFLSTHIDSLLDPPTAAFLCFMLGSKGLKTPVDST
jgi:hypothetical protein